MNTGALRKSHIAEAVRDHINEISQSFAADGKEVSVVIPMDGYHLERKELKKLAEDDTVFESDQFGEDNEEVEKRKLTYEQLLARRGAPFTYCPSKFIDDLKKAKKSGEGSFPVYNRSKHDPVKNGVQIKKHHKLIFVEGLYLLCTDDPDWQELHDILDDKWYIEVSLEETKRRLVERHLKSWNDQKTKMYGGNGPKAAAKKAETNDMINARCIKRHSKEHADLIIRNEEVTNELRDGDYRRGEEIIRDSALYA